MRSLAIIELEVAFQTPHRVIDRLVVLDVNVFILDRTPQPLDEHVVQRPASSVHADSYSSTLQLADELGAGELRALVAVEDLGLSLSKCPVQRRQAEPSLQGDRHFPTQHVSAEPIHDRYQVHKAVPQSNVGDVRAPHLVHPPNPHSSQSIQLD